MPLNPRTRKLGLTLLASASVLAMSVAAMADVAPTALPTGGAVTAGNATISQQNASLTVNQSSQRAIINWQTFNVGGGAAVNFVQPNSAAVALNRVLSSTPSTIDGKITANGQVFLINPAGIVFGAGAAVNVGGLVASTMDIADADFMAGKNSFSRNGSAGTIDNQGTLTAAGGLIALLAPELRNEGVISAQLGTIVLAAGEKVVLNIDTAGGVTVQVDPAQIRTLIDNRSIVVADSGKVILSAKAADALLGSTINNEGTIEAASLTGAGGSIELSGATSITNTGTIDASGTSGGTIKIAADQTAGLAGIGGTVSVAGKNGIGGTATVTGNDVLIDGNAKIDATGTTGGGTINVGGSWENQDATIPQSTGVIIAPTARLDASATVNGNGGTVVARSDIDNPNSVTRAYGTFLANGGAMGGDGGRIETSGYFLDTAGARVGAMAFIGAPGEWLLDPFNVTISGTASAAGSFNSANPDIWTPNATGSNILASDIAGELNGGTSVTITTGNTGGEQGNIIVNSDITKTSGNAAVNLILSAQNDVHLNANIANTGGTGHMNVQIVADSAHTGNGIIYLNGDITTGGGDLTFGQGSGINLNGNNTLVSGDVYVNDTVAHTLNTGGGNFFLEGQLIIRDAAGLTVTTSGGVVTFGGAVDSGNDYTLVSAPNTDWATDLAAAKSGVGGAVGDTYLATVTSHLEGEIVALTTIFGGAFQATWLGGERVTGLGTDNIWRWVTGPEGLKNNGQGLPFFKQNGSDTVNGNSGLPVNGMYNNWNNGEPNNFGGGNLTASGTHESILQTLGATGQWNDLPRTGSNLDFYVKETNAADSPLTINAGSGQVTFNGTVGGNKALSSLTLNTTASNIEINGGGVFTDSTQTYTVPISLGNTNVTLAVLNGDLITRSGQTYGNDTGADSSLTLSASGNLELTANTQPEANGHKQNLTLSAGNTLTLDPNVALNSNGGAITMIADHLSVDPAASTVGGASGSLQIEPFTQGTSMGVGAGAAGTLSLTSADFTGNFINNTFGTVIFGGPTTGLVTVGATPTLIHDKTVFESGANMTLAANADLNPTGIIGFSLDSVGGTLTEDAAATINVGSLLLSGNSFFLSGTGAFNLTNAHNTIGTIAAANAASINVIDQSSLIVGSVGNANVGTTDGVGATGDITLQAAGATSDITLNKPVTSTGGNVTLAAGRNFINNNTADTGIVASGAGKQWFVYASTPAGTVRGMTTGFTDRYNQPYTSGSVPAVANSGNWFFYTASETLTENLNPATITYGAADPTLTASYTGFVNGDTATSAQITGTVGSIAAFTASGAGHRPAGTFTTTATPGSLTNISNYTIVAGPTGTLTVNKLNVTAAGFTAADKFFDGNTTAAITGVSGVATLLSGDHFTGAGGVANFFDSASATGKTVTESSLFLTGADGGNYNVTTTGLTTTATIKPSLVFVPPVNTTNVTPPPPPSTVTPPPPPEDTTTASTQTATTPQQQTQQPSPQTSPFIANANTGMALSVPSAGGGIGQGVVVTQIQTGPANAGGNLLVTVGDGNSHFGFTVSAGNFTANNPGATSATLQSGDPLPSWLSYNPATHTFAANNVPPGGLPVVVAINDLGGGTGVEVTISQ